MLLSEAKKFHATRASVLQLAERATEPDVKKSLIELSIWMEAALKEERHIFDERSPNTSGSISSYEYVQSRASNRGLTAARNASAPLMTGVPVYRNMRPPR